MVVPDNNIVLKPSKLLRLDLNYPTTKRKGEVCDMIGVLMVIILAGNHSAICKSIKSTRYIL